MPKQQFCGFQMLKHKFNLLISVNQASRLNVTRASRRPAKQTVLGLADKGLDQVPYYCEYVRALLSQVSLINILG